MNDVKFLKNDEGVLTVERYSDDEVTIYWDSVSLGFFSIVDLKNLLRVRRNRFKSNKCLQCGLPTFFSHEVFCCVKCKKLYEVKNVVEEEK